MLLIVLVEQPSLSLIVRWGENNIPPEVLAGAAKEVLNYCQENSLQVSVKFALNPAFSYYAGFMFMFFVCFGCLKT